jgi:hypothetical protein
MILIVCILIPLTDYPLAAIPRSSHSYLLVYAVGGALFLRHERFYVKTVMPFIAFAFYLIYAVSDISSSELLHPPEHIMTTGVFINYFTSVALIFGILIIFRGDYTNEKYLTYALSKAIKNKPTLCLLSATNQSSGKSGFSRSLTALETSRQRVYTTRLFHPDS